MTIAVHPFSGTFAADRSSGAASHALAADGSVFRDVLASGTVGIVSFGVDAA